MNDEETCVCEEHGVQPITFVCKHIIGVPRGETVGFVSGPSEGENDLRDAWCDACHSFLKAHGGEWLEGAVEVPTASRLSVLNAIRPARPTRNGQAAGLFTLEAVEGCS